MLICLCVLHSEVQKICDFFNIWKCTAMKFQIFKSDGINIIRKYYQGEKNANDFSCWNKFTYKIFDMLHIDC
jgi:hypothetical protein